MTYTSKSMPGSEVHFTIQITANEIQPFYTKALANIVSRFEMDGFRKGAVPENIVLQKVGSLSVWEEALRDAIPDIYVQVLTESKVPAIGRPGVTVTKIADKSDAEVVVVTAVLPEITLPDYKKIAKEVYKDAKPNEVTNEDVVSALLDLRRMRAQKESPNTEVDVTKKPEEIDEKDLPELTEEYLKGFSPEITTVEELSARIKHNLEHERIHQLEDKKRSELITKLSDATEMELPNVLVEYEMETMLRQYEHDLMTAGIALDDYLKVTNKTREALREEIKDPATKRARSQLLLEKIGKEENIEADPEKIETELKALIDHYKDSKEFDEGRAKAYLEQVYTNQAIFAFLEKAGGYTPHNHAEWEAKQK